MADTVRYIMEEMVPELEEFVKQRYFSRKEVKQIVKRRQEFEYALKRRAALKEDYLRYIEYESNLEALRQHRRQALLREHQAAVRQAEAQGKPLPPPKLTKGSLANHAIVRRIHFIYERALRKFRSDVSLWTAWLEFCRSSSSNRRLGRVVGRALQIHPTEPGLWVYAAAWEMESNSNPAAARALMQQGLRMAPHSERMWLAYLDLELMYVEKVVARRRVLGLDVPTAQEAAAAAAAGAAAAAAGAGRARAAGAAEGGGDAAAAAGGGNAAAAGAAAAAGDEQQEDGEGPETDAEAAAAAAAAGGDGAQPSLSALLASNSQGGAPPQDGQAAVSALQDPQAAMTAVLSGAVARLVYAQALKAGAAAAAAKGGASGLISSANYLAPPPSSSGAAGSSGSSGGIGGLGFRAKCLEVLAAYSSPGVPHLVQEVLASIRRDFPQDPAAADVLARAACDPSDPSASSDDVHAAVQEYERLLGNTAAETDTAGGGGGDADAAGGSKRSKRARSSKRQKTTQSLAAAAGSEAVRQSAVQLTPVALAQVYRLYCSFLQERLAALSAQQPGHAHAHAHANAQAHALAAAGVAQQLFKLLLAAHSAGVADGALYELWVSLALQLQQHKVALTAARLATEALPSSAAAWQTRLVVEQQAAAAAAAEDAPGGHGSKGSSAQRSACAAHDAQKQRLALLELVQRALQQVPAAEAEQLWRQGFDLSAAAAAAAGAGADGASARAERQDAGGAQQQPLVRLQQALVAAVTRAAVKGPPRGGLGAAAAAALRAVWATQGAGAARALWQRLLLLPPAGGDMFRAMVALESQQQQQGQGQGQGQGQEQQGQQQQLAPDALARVRGVYEAWAGAYGASDAALWVELALLEQQAGRGGAGKVYWRAVRALAEPEGFIEEYRRAVGL